MPLAEKAVGKGRQPLSPPQRRVARSAHSAPYRNFQWTESSLFTGLAADVTFPCVE